MTLEAVQEEGVHGGLLRPRLFFLQDIEGQRLWYRAMNRMSDGGLAYLQASSPVIPTLHSQLGPTSIHASFLT